MAKSITTCGHKYYTEGCLMCLVDFIRNSKTNLQNKLQKTVDGDELQSISSDLGFLVKHFDKFIPTESHHVKPMELS